MSAFGEQLDKYLGVPKCGVVACEVRPTLVVGSIVDGPALRMSMTYYDGLDRRIESATVISSDRREVLTCAGHQPLISDWMCEQYGISSTEDWDDRRGVREA